MFEIIPAVDVLKGRCVRLKQGRYEEETVYSNDPVEMAKKWEGEGAGRLHVVDLDGARSGKPQNLEIIKSVLKAVKIPIQLGGGIRSLTLIRELLDLGIQRVILGTAAIKNPDLLPQACQEFGHHIIVSIDAKDGFAAAEGWEEVSQKEAVALAQEMLKIGVKRFIYTDISKDGMLSGPNFKGIENFVSQVSAAVIASGGISSKEDVEKLKTIGVEGGIIGKALYAGQIKLSDLV